jgi:hypothetical protein
VTGPEYERVNTKSSNGNKIVARRTIGGYDYTQSSKTGRKAFMRLRRHRGVDGCRDGHVCI